MAGRCSFGLLCQHDLNVTCVIVATAFKYNWRKEEKIEEKKNSDIPASLNEPRVQSTNQPPHVRNPGCSIRLWIEYSLMAQGDWGGGNLKWAGSRRGEWCWTGQVRLRAQRDSVQTFLYRLVVFVARLTFFQPSAIPASHWSLEK